MIIKAILLIEAFGPKLGFVLVYGSIIFFFNIEHPLVLHIDLQ